MRTTIYVGDHISDFVVIYTPHQDKDIEESLYSSDISTDELSETLTKQIVSLLSLNIQPTKNFVIKRKPRRRRKKTPKMTRCIPAQKQ